MVTDNICYLVYAYHDAKVFIEEDIETLVEISSFTDRDIAFDFAETLARSNCYHSVLFKKAKVFKLPNNVS